MDKAIAEQLEVFGSYIRERSLRMTRQRELVVVTFLESDGHLSTDELHELVKKKNGSIGYATVFRTLKALTECGLARETDLADGIARYEHFYKRPRHHHIQCVHCHRTIEFFSPELEQLQERIVSQYRFEPLRDRFQVFGVCEECQAREDGPSAPPDAIDSELVFARDALKIAMETERRGVAFYTAAAEKVSHPSTRETFLEMLEDEKGHMAGLEKEWVRLSAGRKELLDAPVFLHFDYDALQKIFPSREEIERKLSSDMSEEEALRLAMEMELEAFHFFRDYAEKFNDTKGRDIFLKFAAEEEEHYTTIRAALRRLQSATR